MERIGEDLTEMRGEMTGRATGRGSLVERRRKRVVVGVEGLQAGAEVDSSSAPLL